MEDQPLPPPGDDTLQGWQRFADEILRDQGNLREDEQADTSHEVREDSLSDDDSEAPSRQSIGRRERPCVVMKARGELTLKYQIGESIGRGAFGEVHKGKRLSDGEDVVVKNTNIAGMTAQERDATRNEVDMLASLDHPNIVKYYDCFADATSMSIVMEYCGNGDLTCYLKQRDGQLLTEDEIMIKFVQMCLALQCVHREEIVHRDLKCSNIFLSDYGIVKLGDFGISKAQNTLSDLHSMVGTPRYMAPEVLKSKPYDTKSDIFSLGCVLYEMASLRPAFEGDNFPAIIIRVIKGEYSPLPDTYSAGLNNLVKRLLARKPQNRPSIDELLRSSFVRHHIDRYEHHIDRYVVKRQDSLRRSVNCLGLLVDDYHAGGAVLGPRTPHQRPSSEASPTSPFAQASRSSARGRTQTAESGMSGFSAFAECHGSSTVHSPRELGSSHGQQSQSHNPITQRSRTRSTDELLRDQEVRKDEQADPSVKVREDSLSNDDSEAPWRQGTDRWQRPSVVMKARSELTLEYSIRESIDRGAFGEAHKGKRLSDGEDVVIKNTNIVGMTAQERDATRNEVDVLASLDHPNIVKYYDCFADATSMSIVMEYCGSGDLACYLKQRDGQLLTEDEIMMKFVQMCLALQCIHREKIVHRNLKCSNIFLSDWGIVKLGDFGISKANNTLSDLHSMVGTPRYMAPEILKSKPYNHKADIFSLGCVLYEMASLRPAFEGDNFPAIIIRVINGKYSPLPDTYSAGLNKLVRRLLARKPQNRPSIDELLRSSFVRHHIGRYEHHIDRYVVQRQDSFCRSIDRLGLLVDDYHGEDANGNGAASGPASVLDSYSAGLNKLVKELLNREPHQRPSIDELLRSSFVKHHIDG